SSDPLTLRDTIAGQMAAEVLSTLSANDTYKRNAHDTSDPRAYEAYLKGQYFLNKHSRDEYFKAINEFDAAIAIEPSYARAYAGLADARQRANGDGYLGPNMAVQKAKAAAPRASPLDPSVAEPRTSLALIYQQVEWDWRRAEQGYPGAIAADPNYVTARHW